VEFMQYLLVALGGVVGATSRYYLQGLVYRWLGVMFPWGTLAVNLLGCFFIGFLLEWAESRIVISNDLKIFLTIGVLGSFTTFSTFSYESMALLRSGELFLSIINVVSHIVGGLCLAWAGMMVAKVI
jgi:fluoride exporter